MSSMDFSVRRMTDDDLASVAEIEAGVFTDWYRVHRRKEEAVPERTIEELRYATSLDPDGNSVAVSAEGALVGFVLARTWGSVGWFGTFGVPTQLQGLGIGTALAERTIDYLRRRASTIGLETMPESGANIGFYSRLGFAAGYPTVILELSLIQESERLAGASASGVIAWGERDARARKRLLREMHALTDAIHPGLDYRREVEGIEAHGLGKTLLSLDEGRRLRGFVVLRTAPFRTGDTSGRAYIHIMAVRRGSDHEAVVGDLLSQVWTRATKLGFSKVTTGVSSRYQGALELMFLHGFRGLRTVIRMIHRASPPSIFAPDTAINVSRWAG